MFCTKKTCIVVTVITDTCFGIKITWGKKTMHMAWKIKSKAYVYTSQKKVVKIVNNCVLETNCYEIHVHRTNINLDQWTNEILLLGILVHNALQLCTLFGLLNFFGFKRHWWVFCRRNVRLAYILNLVLVSTSLFSMRENIK